MPLDDAPTVLDAISGIFGRAGPWTLRSTVSHSWLTRIGPNLRLLRSVPISSWTLVSIMTAGPVVTWTSVWCLQMGAYRWSSGAWPSSPTLSRLRLLAVSRGVEDRLADDREPVRHLGHRRPVNLGPRAAAMRTGVMAIRHPRQPVDQSGPAADVRGPHDPRAHEPPLPCVDRDRLTHPNLGAPRVLHGDALLVADHAGGDLVFWIQRAFDRAHLVDGACRRRTARSSACFSELRPTPCSASGQPPRRAASRPNSRIASRPATTSAYEWGMTLGWTLPSEMWPQIAKSRPRRVKPSR